MNSDELQTELENKLAAKDAVPLELENKLAAKNAAPLELEPTDSIEDFVSCSK